jgi:hypothetical protein
VGRKKNTDYEAQISARDATARRVRAGEMVEVRSKEEILATLDERGRLHGMPFMPEMLQYCGQRFPCPSSEFLGQRAV